ncbi:MAG: tryptophan--tRNA ligase [Alphaproteobacteria bacterium]|nr:tryptophan--tRNA ligase [Alphaproteobacteria bacterium]
MKRILSCMQPTNNLHLGNYLGALKNWVHLQDEPDVEECLYGVVDLHAITQPYDKDVLARSTREIAAAYIAGGIDPKRSAIFVQSAIPEHSQLMWLFATMTQMGKLERMTQFKDKAGKNSERAGLGLFSYPVLMAADILVYKATHVPVGDDQKQHLELAREIAGTFNARYGEGFFPLIEPVITGAATRVMSLKDGSQKMSKSAESDNSRINLTDDADVIVKKFRKAKTDSHPVPATLEEMEGRPEARNLLTIYASLADKDMQDVLNEFGGKQFSELKQGLADIAVARLAPITARMSRLLDDVAEIDRVLEQGNEKARVIAASVLAETKHLMGFWK